MKRLHLREMTLAEAQKLELEDVTRSLMLEHAAELRREAQRYLDEAEKIEREFPPFEEQTGLKEKGKAR